MMRDHARSCRPTVIITDSEGCVTKLNPAAEEVFGSEKESISKHVGELARDERIAAAVAEALESQRPVAGEGMSSVLPLAVDGDSNSFWTSQAQRLLSDYLWKEGKVPPTRTLAIKDVDRDELPTAARWQSV